MVWKKNNELSKMRETKGLPAAYDAAIAVASLSNTDALACIAGKLSCIKS